jgi:hypothetical protein
MLISQTRFNWYLLNLNIQVTWTMPIEFYYSVAIYFIAFFAAQFRGNKIPFYSVIFLLSLFCNLWAMPFIAGLILGELSYAKVISRSMKSLYGRISLYFVCFIFMAVQLLWSKKAEISVDGFVRQFQFNGYSIGVYFSLH